jgi:hypothetical protein
MADAVTNSGSGRVTNRVTGTRRVTSLSGSEGQKPADGASGARSGENFFEAERGMELVTVSLEV